MISQTAEYALRAIVCLADAGDEPRTTEQISQLTLVGREYLAKVLQSLRQAGLIRAKRGKNGGFQLAKTPEELTVLEIVNAIDPLKRITHCPLGLVAHQAELCPLHTEIDAAMDTVEAAFRETTIANLLHSRKPSSTAKRCPFPLQQKL